jgi:hypothetical protein
MVITRVAPAVVSRSATSLALMGTRAPPFCPDGHSRNREDHGGNPTGRGPFQGIDHEEQFNQVVIDRVTGGLNHEDILGPHIFIDLDLDLTVAESLDLHRHKGHSDIRKSCTPDPDSSCL